MDRSQSGAASRTTPSFDAPPPPNPPTRPSSRPPGESVRLIHSYISFSLLVIRFRSFFLLRPFMPRMPAADALCSLLLLRAPFFHGGRSALPTPHTVKDGEISIGAQPRETSCVLLRRKRVR